MVKKIQKDELSGDREIVKNNQLINAHYRLTANEQKLVLTLCSKIKSDDITFKEFSLSKREFLELMNLNDSGKNYQNLKSICDKLASRVFTIDTGNGFRKFSWLHHIEYQEKESKILIQFHDCLAPYLLYVKNNIYTKYKLGMVLQFKSEYTIRIYELCKQYLNIGSRTIILDELRKILGLNDKEYARYNNFKRIILEKAQTEINKKSDVEIKLNEIKQGKKVTSINFEIERNFNFVEPIDNWYDYQKYKNKSIDDISEILTDIIMEYYKVSIPVQLISNGTYDKTAILQTVFELKEGYYRDRQIKNPTLYFLQVLDNKTKQLEVKQDV